MTDEVFSRYKFGISSSRFLVKITVGYIQESAWPCLAKQFLYFLALKWQISTRGRFLNFWVLTRGFLLYRTFDTSEWRDFLDVSFSSRLRKSISRLLLALHFIFARGKRDYFRTVIITCVVRASTIHTCTRTWVVWQCWLSAVILWKSVATKFARSGFCSDQMCWCFIAVKTSTDLRP